jgi:MFS family permease
MISSVDSLQNGAHLAAVIGGFVANAWGFRWCFWLPTIIWGINWIVDVFCLPETLYYRHRSASSSAGEEMEAKPEPWLRLFTFNSSSVGRRKLVLSDFLHVFKMLQYPSVLFPTIYYSICFGVGTVLFAVTGAAAFGSIYHFNTAQIGMIIGLPTLIGSLIGEACAGPVSDWILYTHTKRNHGVSTPEARLQAIWPGFIIMPIGVIIEGVCLQFHTHWIGPAMGMAVGLFGLQIISTNLFAYTMDVSSSTFIQQSETQCLPEKRIAYSSEITAANRPRCTISVTGRNLPR